MSSVLLEVRDRLPDSLHEKLPALADASRTLRRDRELAFYGAEDLTPSGFYSRTDADRARSSAAMVVKSVGPHVGRGPEPHA